MPNRKLCFLVVAFVALLSLPSISQTVVASNYANTYSLSLGDPNHGAMLDFCEFTMETPDIVNSARMIDSNAAQNFGDVNAGSSPGFVPGISEAPNDEYIWNGGTTDFNLATNWTPPRILVQNSDRLVFESGTYNVTDVPNQTIGQLVVRINANITLRNLTSGTTSTLTLTGGDGEDFSIDSGSSLDLNVQANGNNNAMAINLNTGVTGTIDGAVVMDNSHGAGLQPHRLLAVDAGSIQVSGTITAERLVGNPFGASGSIPVIAFYAGSVYNHHSGASPFGDTMSDVRVVFNTGSWYVFAFPGGAPNVTGRTYANFKYDIPNTKDATGGSNYFIDTLLINQGSYTFKLTATGTIAGDIEVKSGASLGFTPASGSAQVIIDAPVVQNIFGAGTLIFGVGTTLNLQNQNRINIQKDIVMDGTGTANIVPNAVVAFQGENGFTGTGTTDIQNNSTVYLGSVNGISFAASTGNVRTDTRTYSPGAAYVYNGTVNQNTGIGLPVTLTAPGRIEIDNPGTVTLTNSGTTGTPLLTLTAGLFEVGPANTLEVTAAGTISSTAGNFAAGNLAGTVSFLGTGTVNATGDLDFWNVNLASGTGGVNFGSTGTPRIHNELVISNGRWVDTNPPFYADGSTLVYNTGTNFGAGDEWETNAITGRGVPYNVQVGRSGVDDSELTFSASGQYRHARNSVTIGHPGAGTGYALTLGGSFGDDLHLEGEFALEANGQFNANQRAVFFTGTANQTITSKAASNEIDFDYMVVNKTGGELLLNNSPGTTVNVNGSTGNLLVLSGGDIDLQGQTFNLGVAAVTNGYLQVNGGDRTVKSTVNADFNFHGPTMEVTGSFSGALKFENDVTVTIDSSVDFGASGLTVVDATLQINAGGFANLNAPYYGESATLKYNTGGVYERRVEWDAGFGFIGYPNDVVVANNTTLKAGGAAGGFVATPFGARRDVIIESGSAIDMSGDNMTVPLEVGRDLTIDGTLTASGAVGGDIHVGGNWVRNSGGVFNANNRKVLFNGSAAQSITADTGEVFDYLAFDSIGVKSLNDPITVHNDLEILSLSGDLSPGSHTINLEGNWNNQSVIGGFAHGTSTVRFGGSAVQRLTSPGGENFYNVEIANTDSGLVLMDEMIIAGNLALTDGHIHARNKRVEFLLSATTSGAGEDSFINGMAMKTGGVQKVAFVYPVGDYRSLNNGDSIIDVYQPAGVAPNNTNTTTAFMVDYNHNNYFPGTYYPNNPPPTTTDLKSVSTCNYWNISRTAGSQSAKVRLYWTDECLNIIDVWSLVVAKVIDDGNGGEIWETMYGTMADDTNPAQGGFVESGLLSSFSPFTIATFDTLNVLPIGLISFTATPKDKIVETRWVTSTEINNEYFSMERSVDAENFTTIGRVEGAGNSTTELSYSFTDEHPYAGISYYRLKQTDFDGKATYSDIRSVKMDTDKRFELINVYRSERGVNLSYRSDVEILQAEVFDLLGKRLFTTRIENNNGQSIIQPSLVRGIYLLRLSNGVEVVSRKFFY